MNTKIIPHLSFHYKAKDAINFYMRFFNDSEILNITSIKNENGSSSEKINFQIAGTQFQATSEEVSDKFNQALSLTVLFNSKAEAEILWNKIKDHAVVLRPFGPDEYKQIYASLEDQYGLVWQIMTTSEKIDQRILPSLLFTNQAEEAMIFYGQVFENSIIETVHRKKGSEYSSIILSESKIKDLKMSFMDVEPEDNPGFNESLSFMILCDNQEEIDFYWNKLSDKKEVGRAGRTTDKFGLSWQIIPERLFEMIRQGSDKQRKVLNQALSKMNKITLKEIEEAFKDES